MNWYRENEWWWGPIKDEDPEYRKYYQGQTGAGDRKGARAADAAGCQLVAACDLAVAAEETALRHTRREDRPLLLDADGAASRGRSVASVRSSFC